MRFVVDIDYPVEKMEDSRARLEARREFRYIDRVPINYCVVPRYFMEEFGLPYLDYFSDVETQFSLQLQFAKYHIEHIPSDFCTRPVVTVHPYFDNVIPPSGQGGEIGWVDSGPPRAVPIVDTVEKMNAFEVARPTTGLRGKAVEWWMTMRRLAEQTRVSFAGAEGAVEVSPLSLGGLSPHMIAVDLVGEDFYWWMIEYPEECHAFLGKITRGEILSEENCRKIDPRPRGGYVLAEDSAQIMSSELFERFCVPYAEELFKRYGDRVSFGRAIHMCGDSTHLHHALKEKLIMQSFDVFGYPVAPDTAAKNLGGSTLLWGNLNPMLMKEGPTAAVREAALECIREIGPCGGFMLGDGANVCPGTPLSCFEAIMETAESYGLGGGGEPILPRRTDRVAAGIRNTDSPL